MRTGGRLELTQIRRYLLYLSLVVAALGQFGCDKKASNESEQGEKLKPKSGSSCTESSCQECGPCEPYERCIGGGCSCETRCTDETACLDDSCGGTCPCPEGSVQTASGQWVAPEECTDTCETGGWFCGKICGQDCGSCESGESCQLGKCACKPTCDGSRCEDGCGGYCPCGEGTVCNAAQACVPPDECHDTCESEELGCGEMCGEACGTCKAEESCIAGACVHATSCIDCPLSLSLVEKEFIAGKLASVTLAVDFEQTEQVEGPRIADFRIKSSKAVWLKEAAEGPALINVGKKLQAFPPWDDPFRKRSDGTFQVLAYSTSDSKRMETGRLATLRFALDEWGPVTFSLMEREQTFAPPDADAAIFESGYDGDVVVTR